MSLINVFVAVRNALIDGRRRRRDYDQLMALDDRFLADIGMHRSQLPAIVEAMYRCAALCPVAAPALSPRAAIEHAPSMGGWAPPANTETTRTDRRVVN